MAGPNGMSVGGPPNFDGLGIFYIFFAALWTVIVFAGLVWLHSLRFSIAVRIRNFWLIASAVVMLGLYEIAVLIRYPMNGVFKCGAEFWIMSAVLPFSIALFQAANIQLLSYYEEQQHLASLSFRVRGRLPFIFTRRGLQLYWKKLTMVEKTYVGIAIGLVIQIVITLFLYFGSRAFHKSYGFFGPRDGLKKCTHTPEWAPSVFWQFLWSAVFGPYVLYRIRFIRDTHYWALQTRLAIIACLPGTPMWLIFRYADTTMSRHVNSFLVPAMWFLPGLMTMQIVSIAIPIYDAYRSAEYNKRASSTASEFSVKSKEHYNMSALELQISDNIEPLLEWSSKRDFTAENIVFLMTVRDFKKKWSDVEKTSFLASPAKARQCFEEAGLIYFNLVNPTTAQFNINIASATRFQLDCVFSSLLTAARPDEETKPLRTEEDVIAPWSDMLRLPTTLTRFDLLEEIDRIYQTYSSDGATDVPTRPVPPSFNVDVFDKAVKSIKYLVFTNSWTRFVDDQETRSSTDSSFSQSTKA